MSGRSSRTIYVGNLPGDIRLREVEDLFYKVWLLIQLRYICENYDDVLLVLFLGLNTQLLTHEKKTSRS